MGQQDEDKKERRRAGREYMRGLRELAKSIIDTLRLQQRMADSSLMPPMPAKSPDGTFPGARAMRALMAQKIMAARKAAGLSRAALARKAGIGADMLARLEKGKHTPNLATMAKINKALDDAGAPK